MDRGVGRRLFGRFSRCFNSKEPPQGKANGTNQQEDAPKNSADLELGKVYETVNEEQYD